jgi:osmotically-inducible protein OsmY
VAAPIADREVTEGIEQEILFDPAVPFDAIDIATTNGVVTLQGRVKSLLAKERAERIAETVRGVRSVVNLIEVRPTTPRSARQLREQVKDALLYDAVTEAYEIAVSADDRGAITLNGTVDSWAERDIAEIVAKGVSGVTAVANDIEVKPRTDRLDVEIKAEIARRLQWDTLVDDALIEVRVNDAKVDLSGTVGSAAEKRRVEWNAWMVAGVESVDDSGLSVERWARDEDLRADKYAVRSDAEIRNAVVAALRADPRVSAFDVDVKSRAGFVTLTGVVGAIPAKEAAERDARSTVGVIGVNNLIKVRPVGDMSNEDIAQAVREALARNPFTEGYEIDVSAAEGVVYLAGLVDSYFDKAEAEQVAFRARGVTAVRNDLAVLQPEVLTYDPYVDDWKIYDFTWYDAASDVQSKSDVEIRNAIEQELAWSPFVDSDDVEVSVTGAVATLVGAVDSWSEYHAARENAFEGGAVTVVNRLDVR